MRRKYANRPDYIAVTASTGMAASNIGGECDGAVAILGTLIMHNWIFRNDSSLLGCSDPWEQRH